jgi:hypothetical protein
MNIIENSEQVLAKSLGPDEYANKKRWLKGLCEIEAKKGLFRAVEGDERDHF